MTSDALFWRRLHSELGQLVEYAEFRQQLAQMASRPHKAPRVQSGEKARFEGRLEHVDFEKRKGVRVL